MVFSMKLFKEIKDEQRVIFLTIVDQKEVAFETTEKTLRIKRESQDKK